MFDLLDGLMTGALFHWNDKIWVYISFVKAGEKPDDPSYALAVNAYSVLPSKVVLVPYKPSWGLKPEEVEKLKKECSRG